MWRPILDALVPLRCGLCAARSSGPLCGRCDRELRRAPTFGAHRLAGLDAAWAGFEHSGVARQIVAAAKFRARLGLVDLAVGEMAIRMPSRLMLATLVPVPPDPWRARRRGFDVAARIADRLADLTSSELADPLRRSNSRPQAGKDRGQRLTARLEIRASRPLPSSITLIDDVVTTGATLRACADAARRAGAVEIRALTMTRTRL